MTTQILATNSINLDLKKIPQHVAVIMDGNGRWAKQRGLPRIAGHRQGANTLKEILRTCKNYGIKTLTTYAFSTENWSRPKQEVDFLMSLFEKLLEQELRLMNKEGIRIRLIGDLTPLPRSLQQIINKAVTITKKNNAVNFNIAINYGSRLEIVKACQKIAHRVHRGKLAPEKINESTISNHLDTFASPDPDLLIRTSGEMRLSNFLLWQMAYTEIYVSKTFWPDFNSYEFLKAIADFQQRDRRFGKINAT